MDLQSDLKRRARRRRLLAARRYRSRRFWRTISRRRRTLGLFVLLVIVAALWAGYYYTRPNRVERLAEDYLTELTGRHVEIDEAHFSPFEGIVLKKVKVYPPAGDDGVYRPSDEEPIFTADELLLELAPGSILQGRLKVERIVAQRAQIIQAIGGKGGEEPWMRERRGGVGGWDITLPTIELRECEYRGVYVSGTPPKRDVHRRVTISGSLRPDPERPGWYQVDLQGGKEGAKLKPIAGNFCLKPFSLELGTRNLFAEDEPLPLWVQQKLERYNLKGKVDLRVSFDDQTGVSQARVRLRGAGMTLPLSELGVKSTTQPDGAPPALGGFTDLELADVHGEIIVERQALKPDDPAAAGREEIRFEEISVEVLGQKFNLDGRYEGFDADAPFRLTLSNPKFTLPQDAELIAKLPPAVRRIHEQYRPAGNVNFEVIISRDSRGEAVQVEGAVGLLDCAATYHNYPYRMEHVTGTISFNDRELKLQAIRGVSGDAWVTLDGAIGLRGHQPHNLSLAGGNFDVDERLKSALSHHHESLVDLSRRLGVDGGRADWTCIVSRADAPNSPWTTDLTINFHDVPMKSADFPYAAIVRKGTVLYNDVAGDKSVLLRGFQIQPAHVPDNDLLARILADGKVRHVGDGPKDYETRMEIACASMVVDDKFWAALPQKTAEAMAAYHINGRARVVGELTVGPDGKVQYDFKSRMSDGHILYDGFPYALDQMEGDVRVTQDAVTLTDINGRHGGVPVVGSGEIGLTPGHKTRVSIRSDRMPLDDDIYKALPEEGQKAWKNFSPAGWVGLDVLIDQPPLAEDQIERDPVATTVTVTCLGNSIRYAEFPYPMDNVTGQVIIRPDRIDLIDMAETQGARRIRLAGRIWPKRDNINLAEGASPQPSMELKILAEGMVFNETLRRAVPWTMRREWNDILPTGEFDLTLSSLKWTPMGETGRWDYTGRLDLRNTRAVLGITLEQVTGNLQGRGVIVPGQASGFVGRIDLASAQVSGHRLTDVKGRVIQDARNDSLIVDDLTARLYDGLIGGQVQMDLSGENTPYSIAVSGRNLDINKMLNAQRDPGKDPVKVSGRLDGNIAIQGKAGLGSRIGRGALQLRRAQIYELPPVLQLFNAGNLAGPRGASQAARVNFYFDGNKVTFEEVVLRDPSISLMGTGKMDWATNELDLTLVAGEPSAGATGGMKVIEEFFTGAGEELMKYRVSGKFEEPKVEAIPLGTLRQAIEELTIARRRYETDRAPPPATEKKEEGESEKQDEPGK